MLRLRVVATAGMGAVFAIAAATAVMAAGVTCKEPEPGKTSGFIDKTGSDGSFCSANSDGGPANARAAGNGSVASAATDVQGKATSRASSGGLAVSDGEDGGTASATASRSGNADAGASGDHPGHNGGVDKTKATATASNLGTADAHSTLQGSSSAKANSGHAGAFSDGGVAKAASFRNGTAFADAIAADCFATAGASDNSSDASAACIADNGIAKAFAKQGGVADAKSHADCSTSAVASTNGIARAQCDNHDTFVMAKATGGATAIGSDINPPFCDTSGGGTAMVHSPPGDCH